MILSMSTKDISNGLQIPGLRRLLPMLLKKQLNMPVLLDPRFRFSFNFSVINFLGEEFLESFVS